MSFTSILCGGDNDVLTRDDGDNHQFTKSDPSAMWFVIDGRNLDEYGISGREDT